MSRILTIGSINIDEVYSVPHLIRPGETIACTGFERFVGGKGNNQAMALALAGADVSLAGKIGNDGTFILALLQAAGVDVTRVLESAIPTGRAVIQVDQSGQNCIIISAGANGDIHRSDIDGFISGWGQGDAILFQNEVSELEYMIDRAARAELYVYFNPSPIDECIGCLSLGAVDCFIVNEVEGAALAGVSDGNPDSIMRGMRLRFPTAETVLTLGSAGVRYCGPTGAEIYVPAAHVPVVDTTAAGDTFTGYFIAARLRGDVPSAALREATRAAGLCVGRKGASGSIPRRAEIV